MGKLHSLQALRALAAGLVVADHAIVRAADAGLSSEFARDLAWHFGVLGVDMFFVISGFIMIRSAFDEFGEKGGPTRFAYRRLVRIVPLYWLATLIELALRFRHPTHPDMSEILHSLFFTPQVLEPGSPLRPIVGVGWSLNYEMLFYAIFTAFLFLPRNVGIAGILMTLVGLVAAGSFLKPLTDTSLPTTVATFLTDPIILLFAVGMLVGLAERSYLKESVRIVHPLVITSVLVVVAVPLYVAAGRHYPVSLGWALVFDTLVTACVIACVFARRSARSRPLPWIEALGDASYSTYLSHFLVIVAITKAWIVVFGETAPVLCIIIAFLVSSLVGVAVHFAVEKPLIRLLRHEGPVWSWLRLFWKRNPEVA